LRTTSLALSALLVMGLLSAAPAGATEGGEGLSPVANIAYPAGQGTDSDFTTMDVDPGEGVDLRDVGVFGSINGGAIILDVTDGAHEQLGYYDCYIGQGDIQVFQRDEARGTATYFTFTDDGYGGRRGVCQEFGDAQEDFGNRQGTFIVDITDPAQPETINFVPFPKGSHNMTVHPSTNYLYNSNSELITNAAAAAIEVYDITDLRNEVQLPSLRLSPRPGLGTDSHDLTFNEEGTRAYSAALSQTVIIDTTDPAAPTIISSIVDPMINVEHQANPVTITDPILGERDFLIVEDEFAGAAGAEQSCPSGGTHVYDITDETLPVKVGVWFIDDVSNTNAVGVPLVNSRSCTAHVFDIHEDEAIMTMSFYGGGVRVVDLSGLVGASLGGNGLGMREIAYHRFDDSNSWSAKMVDVEVAEDGSVTGTVYSNDIDRGIDVYELDADRAASPVGGGVDHWLSGAELAALAPATMPADYTPFCLLKGRTPTQAAADALLTRTGLTLGL
jgi:hypothetical protein